MLSKHSLGLETMKTVAISTRHMNLNIDSKVWEYAHHWSEHSQPLFLLFFFLFFFPPFFSCLCFPLLLWALGGWLGGSNGERLALE